MHGSEESTASRDFYFRVFRVFRGLVSCLRLSSIEFGYSDRYARCYGGGIA
jgi:hypothetical protein